MCQCSVSTQAAPGNLNPPSVAASDEGAERREWATYNDFMGMFPFRQLAGTGLVCWPRPRRRALIRHLCDAFFFRVLLLRNKLSEAGQDADAAGGRRDRDFLVQRSRFLPALKPRLPTDRLGDRSRHFHNQYSAEGAVLTTISHCEFRSLAYL